MKTDIFLTAEWRDLAMLNYQIDPAILRTHVPRGTELDDFNGKHYVSMVGFLFLRTKVLGLPIPFHRNFEEVNLRFYVRRKADAGWRRGVVFIKEIVPRFAIAAVARILYNENYVSLPMRHSNQEALAYEWRYRGRWNRLQVKSEGNWQPIAAGSEEEFIAEHYWGYSQTAEYEVEHPPWRIRKVNDASLDCDVESLYGSQFVAALNGKPASAFLAEGSSVIVRKGSAL